MNSIRVVAVFALSAIGACGAVSDADLGVGDDAAPPIEAGPLEFARDGYGHMDLDATRRGPSLGPQTTTADRNVPTVAISTSEAGDPRAGTSTAAANDPTVQTSTTSQATETIHLDSALDVLDAIDGLVRRFEAEIETVDLEEEGVNP